MKIMNKILILLSLIAIVKAKTYVVVDEELKECAKPGEDYKLFDYSNLQLIPENDTHTFVNGTLKFLREMKGPWHLHMHTEHYERGKWLPQGYLQNIKDYCKEIHNPVQPWYYVTKNLKGCTIPQNHEYILNMVSIELSETTLALIPRHWEGRWRLVVDGIFKVDGKEMHECRMGFGTVFTE